MHGAIDLALAPHICFVIMAVPCIHSSVYVSMWSRAPSRMWEILWWACQRRPVVDESEATDRRCMGALINTVDWSERPRCDGRN
jgi:hypothetical protein